MRRPGTIIRASSFMLALLAATATAQQPGSAITGRITETGTNAPIADANIVLGNTQRVVRSDNTGQYRIPQVAPGTYVVRVTRLGYTASSQSVTVVAGQNATANFVLTAAAAQIDQVIVTATGATERKRENGNDVGIIKPGDKVDLAATPTLTQTLQGKEAGLTITSNSGTPGSSSRIRIRGANSISLSNEPLIIIDGVRVDNNTTGSASLVGGQVTSRFDDINPEEIDRIEVLKGPAASAMYGTAAANGVLQITTKRGRVGKTNWRAYADYGNMWDATKYPDNYYVMGTNTTTNKLYNASCTLYRRSVGLCRPDSTFTFNPIEHYDVQGTGSQIDYGLSAQGGADVAQYYVSGDIQRVQGIVTPNKTHNVNLRANVSAQLRPNLTANFTTSYIDRLVGFPINDNNIYGVVPNGILGHAFNCAPGATGGTATFCGVDTLSEGFYSRNPSTFFFMQNQQIINRFVGGTNVTWQPKSWLTGVLVGGLDVDNALDQSVTPSNIVTNINSSLAQGSVTEYRRQIPTYSASGTLTATRTVRTGLVSTTSLGEQYINEQNHYTYAFGANLVPGTASLAGATARLSVNDNNQTVVTVGTYGNEQLAWNDRVFLTGGLRADRNSAFGTKVTWAYYPSLSASWVVSEENFMKNHAPSFLDQLRLRAAYGQSGQRPAFRQAETYLNSASVAQGSTETPAVVIGGTGSTTLAPEISVETEGGFDANFFNQKIGVQYTYYHKITKDALIAAVLAPSLGVSSSQYENLGRVLNAGHELTMNIVAFDLANSAHLDITLAGSTNNNKLLDLGGQPPIIFSTQRHAQGYPLGAYFAQHYTYADKNGNGIIEPSEITYGDTTAAAEYIGAVLPTHQLAITPTFTYKGLRLGAMLDMRGGNYLWNQTEEYRCASSAFSNCRAVSDPTAPLDDQATAVAKIASPTATSYGYIQPAGFTKLREASATFELPSRFTSHTGFSRVAMTIAGHNLATWTKYKGYDPEVLQSQSNFTAVDFLTQPPLRTWTARLDFNF